MAVLVLALVALWGALAGPVAAQEFAPALVFDMGGKFDKSFNEAAYNGAERFKKETGIAYREFEVTNEAQREQALRNMARRGSQITVGIGFAQATGMALNILMSGLTVVLGYAWFQQGGQTPLLADSARFGPIVLPGAAILARIPVLGLVYDEVVSGHNVLVYMLG